MPFAVAINNFPDSPRYDAEELVEALDLPPGTPVVECDARQRSDSARGLITLVEHALAAQRVAS
jgi:signal recognition particle receptor subunit beta